VPSLQIPDFWCGAAAASSAGAPIISTATPRSSRSSKASSVLYSVHCVCTVAVVVAGVLVVVLMMSVTVVVVLVPFFTYACYSIAMRSTSMVMLL
jgi:hypothetical protein